MAYAIDPAGNLYRYPDPLVGGLLDPAGIQTVGRGGWNSFARVFAGGAGRIYAVASDGSLKRYVDPMTGAEVWFSEQIAPAGWANGFALVFSVGSGIYAIGPTGILNVFSDPGAGRMSSATVGTAGWGGLTIAFNGGQHTFYAADQNGDLSRFNDPAGNGAVSPAGGTVIARSGWGTRRLLFAIGDDTIYAVTPPPSVLTPARPLTANVARPVREPA
ncbi:MAG: hypothetical protein NVSMB18_11970 [Acetobacteraceae bacterium]